MRSPHQFERFAQGHEGRGFAGVEHNAPVLRRPARRLVFLAGISRRNVGPTIYHGPLRGAAVGAWCGSAGSRVRRCWERRPVSIDVAHRAVAVLGVRVSHERHVLALGIAGKAARTAALPGM